MRLKTLLVATAFSFALSAVTSVPTYAQGAGEAELIGYHQLCEKGDRRACIKFGMLIERNKLKHAGWRKSHAEWFWWER